MRTKSHAPLLAGVLGFAFASTGCGTGSPLDRAGEPSEQRAPILGPIAEQVAKIQSEAWEDCDLAPPVVIAQKEIAEELDRRADEITAIDAVPAAADSDWKTVQLGPIFLQERTKFVSVDPVWKESTESWRAIIDTYRAIRGTPTDEKWSQLNRSVRFLLSDELDRVVDGVNFEIDKDAGPFLVAALKPLEACEKIASCVEPLFSAKIRKFLEANTYYRYQMKKLASVEGLEAKRERLTRFKALVESNSKRYGFVRNASAKRISPSKLQVPMRAGVFAGVTRELSRYIEKVWKSPRLSVSVDWVEDTRTDAFAMLVEPGSGSRSYVLQTDLELHLASGTTTMALAHEFGHVLGFKDRYYTVWNPRTCVYTVQMREDELMSATHTGYVTEDDWRILDKTYPLKKF